MQGISVCWFYALQFYYMCWLALVIFWWSLWDFLCRGSSHLQRVRVLLLFQSGLLLFFFMLWLLWPKLPKLCWIVMMTGGTLVLFLTLGEMLSMFHHWGYVCCGFVIYSFCYVEVCSFYSCFLEGFIINGCWILSKAFSASIEIIIWFFFPLVNVVYYVDWFVDIEESLHPWDKDHLVMMHDLLICCWILFAKVLLRIFASMFISDIGL